MSQNENSPRFDLSTVLPVGVGVISLFGICLLLIANRLAAPRSVVQVPDTATPFRYVFLGTEPGISSPVPSEDAISTRPVGFAITAQSGFSSADGESAQPRPSRTATDSPPAETEPSNTQGPTSPTRFPTAPGFDVTNTPITLPTVSGPTLTLAPAATRTQTATSVSAPPLNAGTYDDTDSHLNYAGFWVSQTGQPGAENGTLHVSSTLNDTITFRFIGDQLRIIYQSGSGLGTMTATIDGTQFPALNQSGSPSTRSEWAITGLSINTHTVVLTHAGGGSINIDQVIVPDISPTSTSTATATATP